MGVIDVGPMVARMAGAAAEELMKAAEEHLHVDLEVAILARVAGQSDVLIVALTDEGSDSVKAILEQAYMKALSQKPDISTEDP